MSTPKSLKIEFFRSNKVPGLWFFHIKAGNGLIIASSEGYKNRNKCLKTAALIQNRIWKPSIKPRPPKRIRKR